MTEKTLNLIISRVDGSVFNGKVVSVSVPGVDGDMTILANHEALISPLRKGDIIVRKGDGEEESFETESGTLEISGNNATILI